LEKVLTPEARKYVWTSLLVGNRCHLGGIRVSRLRYGSK
jgi:hypothetical protein